MASAQGGVVEPGAASPSRDYSLVGRESALAVERGLAEATWYTSPVDKALMRELLRRRDWPALRDTLLWFALIGTSGYCAYLLWQAGSAWAIVAFMVYGVLYASSSDSRWHESSHGTAFRTDGLNDALYEIASFMVMRESTLWRWSHTRHHSDTIIVGRDPEIAVPRPPKVLALILSFFAVQSTRNYFGQLLRHAAGRLSPAEQSYVPESANAGIFLRARIYLAIYAGVIALSVWQRSVLPLLYVGLPTLYGSWLMVVYGYTQHAGLAEDVLDHRLNCRTVYMNFINRYLYWNMNYHVEHHMFPLVPYHQLPRLHAVVRGDMPPPYRGLWDAWREIVPALLRQMKDTSYYVRRPLPDAAAPVAAETTGGAPQATPAQDGWVGWVGVCDDAALLREDVVRFDHAGRTYAVYRAADGTLYATDGMCTHGNAHLADGMVKGRIVECAKHNGRFDLADGSPQRAPVCVGLATYPVRARDGLVEIDVGHGKRGACAAKTYTLRVVSNDNVATFIKELVLEGVEGVEGVEGGEGGEGGEGSELPAYQPGQYLQFEIPAYDALSLDTIDVPARFADTWRRQGAFDASARNAVAQRRNYSLASNPARDTQLRFNVRIALPPHGTDLPAGAGSTYVHSLKPGDTLRASGPYGDFLIRPREGATGEMVYVGGGAGMAPLRAHLSYLFETQATPRRVSFWYGARALDELFYRDYFEGLARRHANFSFHPALSDPLPDDRWSASTGMIHEVLHAEYLSKHRDVAAVDYYLCGPPAMLAATREMLARLGVPDSRIAYDAF
jgi:Na(+)-translocating NADH:ubiquinone oxidoreductase F subunit